MERPKGKTYRVRAFDDILGATRAYADNLNKTRAYGRFRVMRRGWIWTRRRHGQLGKPESGDTLLIS